MREYSSVGLRPRWGGTSLAQGYLFLPVNSDGSRATEALKAEQTMTSLQAYLYRAGVPPPDANTQYTVHSFRVGGAVSRSLAGMAVADIMPLVGWESAGVAQMCIGDTPPNHGEKRKRKNHKRACMDANELPTLPEFAKLYAAFPRKDP